MNDSYGVIAVVAVALGTMLVGAYGLRISRTTSDFYVASRTVSPWWNASAIGGEYLSAASFVGIAGLIFAHGPDLLWFPVGYTAGYLVLLTLVAAPLRRSGAYTLPDFAEARFGSPVVRAVASGIAIAIAWLYLLPQFKGAGLTLHTVTGAPDWLGGLIVAVVVTVNVVSGGMRSITFVQAFQYWLKLTAIAVPVIFLLLAWRAQGAEGLAEPEFPVFRQETTVSFDTSTRVHAEESIFVKGTGEIDGVRIENTGLVLTNGYHRFGQGSEFTFPQGASVPHLSTMAHNTNETWALPQSSGADFPLYGAYSLSHRPPASLSRTRHPPAKRAAARPRAAEKRPPGGRSAAARARGPGGTAQPARFFLKRRVAWCPRVKLRSSICLCWILQIQFYHLETFARGRGARQSEP